MKFECLRAERANLFLLSLAIPDMFGICPATTTFLVFPVWFIGSSDKRQEFRELKVPVIVGSDTNLVIVGAVRAIPVLISDVSGIPQR